MGAPPAATGGGAGELIVPPPAAPRGSGRQLRANGGGGARPRGGAAAGATFGETLFAGGAAGVLSRTATAPLDRLKTLVVLRDAFKGTQRVQLSSSRTGVIGGLRLIYDEGGAASLWRGNGVNCLKVVPESAIKFAIFERLKPSADGGGGAPFLCGSRFCAGAAAGMVAQGIMYPLDVVKTRLAASETGVYRAELRHGGRVGHVVKRMLRFEGWRVMYRGLGISLVGMLPYAGIDLATFDYLRSSYQQRHEACDRVPVPVLLLCGVVSSSAAQTATYPVGLVRQRLQAQGMTLDRPAVFSSPWDCFRVTYKKGGMRGLYAGFVPSLLKVAPAAAVSYAVYESMKANLRETREVRAAMLRAASPPAEASAYATSYAMA